MFKEKMNLEAGYTLLDDGTVRRGHLVSRIDRSYIVLDENQNKIGTATVIEQTKPPFKEDVHIVRKDLEGNVVLDVRYVDD
ncbi:hypothetical protein DMS87_09530 [Klebsiella variicola]|jgi:hypothetical protein|uniref:hypothetical protein n=1 Tax=Klebsiella TaxID=570 RepID=UPI000D742723|nr:hypothetical protein [Klebsiella variicola]MCD9683772.1 hypothetical protein [Klebsiella variicola subsp. variicola]MCD9834547.1 hypothetical protein [Klebsiella variicola subsp. variicola]MCW9236557.1 hypothetical protein [Klebsiella variicola]MDU7050469.1 hypothetical protein [Klebsiella variicola]PXK36506.1 hypothetical protein DMR25_09960 [Klebsiella variicola]